VIGPRTGGIAAVTFDLWNTMLVEALPDRCDELRARRLVELLAGWGVSRLPGEVRAAVGAATAQYRLAWAEQRPYRVEEACRLILARLGLDLDGPRRDLVLEIVEDPRDDGGRLCVGATPGAVAVLRRLRSAGIRIGVVSDTGLSPGRALRRYLAALGMAPMIEPAACAFSDEVGSFKPDPRIFARALEALAVEPTATLHVGDIKRSDVQGAARLGMRTVRYRGVYDDPDPDHPEAGAVIDSLEQLGEVIGLGPAPS
jgi:FMN phosphatase YigB (HAD superfamily)